VARETPASYQGFEQGPIRPPSEAHSLLIRVTRNCPWNRCTFCPVYKGQEFSLRHVDNVKRDIDIVCRHVETLRQLADQDGTLYQSRVLSAASCIPSDEMAAFSAALHWASDGMQSIFLQDANSLVMKPVELVEILKHLKQCFPWVRRITSYARSRTLARISDEDLARIREAGLNRIHVGLESGSDRVLEMIKKGVTKQDHINAGIKVKKAGFELSEYIMPGLGGVTLSKEHALETADALNQINPDFIRLRTTRFMEGIELDRQARDGLFQKCSEEMVAREIKVLVEKLEGIRSIFKSDHMFNLLEDVEGQLPDDKERIIDRINSFLELNPEQKALYYIGRGIGVFRGVKDMRHPDKLRAAQDAYERLRATPETVEDIVLALRKGML
jgi:hypothetical protein